MSSTSAALPLVPTFKRATFREVIALLALAWFVPFAVHLVPWTGARPLGAHLLPMFWATFVAAYFFGARLAIVVGLFAPVVNALVTGLPALKFLGGMAVELVVFAALSAWAVRRRPRWLVIAPAAYVVAKIASLIVQACTGALAPGRGGGDLVSSVIGAVAGLVVLTVIHAALVRFYPKTR